MAGKIINVIKDILNVQKAAPIGMKWKEEERTESTQPGNCETSKGKNDHCSKDIKANSDRGRGEGEPVNQAVLQPKQFRKVPIKRSCDFFMAD
jgi:hypothetical protein